MSKSEKNASEIAVISLDSTIEGQIVEGPESYSITPPESPSKRSSVEKKRTSLLEDDDDLKGTAEKPQDYWLKYKTKDSGKFYYYHPVTKKTVWKLPPGAAFRYPGAKDITGNFKKRKETKPETAASSPEKLPEDEIPGLDDILGQLKPGTLPERDPKKRLAAKKRLHKVRMAAKTITTFRWHGNKTVVEALVGEGSRVKLFRLQNPGVTPPRKVLAVAWTSTGNISEQKMKEMEFLMAAESGADISQMLEDGVDVNCCDPQEGWTALMYAASYDDEDCVKLLLAHPDIAVNQRDRSGSNALMKAAQYNSIKALRHLVLAPGLDPNMKQSNGKTALKMAVTNKHYTSVALLLGHADIMPEQVDMQRILNMGLEPLSLGAEMRDKKWRTLGDDACMLLTLLLQREDFDPISSRSEHTADGFDVSDVEMTSATTTCEWCRMLLMGLVYKSESVLHLLLKTDKFNLRQNEVRKILKIAVNCNYKKLVYDIFANEHFRPTDKDLQRALLWAVRTDNDKCRLLLLDRPEVNGDKLFELLLDTFVVGEEVEVRDDRVDGTGGGSWIDGKVTAVRNMNRVKVRARGVDSWEWTNLRRKSAHSEGGNTSMLPTAIDLLTLLFDCKAAGAPHILREMLSLLKHTVPTEQIVAAIAGYGTIKDINATIFLAEKSKEKDARKVVQLLMEAGDALHSSMVPKALGMQFFSYRPLTLFERLKLWGSCALLIADTLMDIFVFVELMLHQEWFLGLLCVFFYIAPTLGPLVSEPRGIDSWGACVAKKLLVFLRLRFLWEFAASLDRGQGGAYRKYDVSKVLKVLFCSLPMMLLKTHVLFTRVDCYPVWQGLSINWEDTLFPTTTTIPTTTTTTTTLPNTTMILTTMATTTNYTPCVCEDKYPECAKDLLHGFSCYQDYCPECSGPFVGYCDKTCEFCWCPPITTELPVETFTTLLMETTQLPFLTTMSPIVTTLSDFFLGNTSNYTWTWKPNTTEAPELPHIFTSFAWCRNTEDNIVDAPNVLVFSILLNAIAVGLVFALHIDRQYLHEQLSWPKIFPEPGEPIRLLPPSGAGSPNLFRLVWRPWLCICCRPVYFVGKGALEYWNRGITMESDEYTGEVATDSTKLTGGSVGKERLVREMHRRWWYKAESISNKRLAVARSERIATPLLGEVVVLSKGLLAKLGIKRRSKPLAAVVPMNTQYKDPMSRKDGKKGVSVEIEGDWEFTTASKELPPESEDSQYRVMWRNLESRMVQIHPTGVVDDEDESMDKVVPWSAITNPRLHHKRVLNTVWSPGCVLWLLLWMSTIVRALELLLRAICLAILTMWSRLAFFFFVLPVMVGCRLAVYAIVSKYFRKYYPPEKEPPKIGPTVHRNRAKPPTRCFKGSLFAIRLAFGLVTDSVWAFPMQFAMSWYSLVETIAALSLVFARPVLIMTALFSPLYEQMCLENAMTNASWCIDTGIGPRCCFEPFSETCLRTIPCRALPDENGVTEDCLLPFIHEDKLYTSCIPFTALPAKREVKIEVSSGNSSAALAEAEEAALAALLNNDTNTTASPFAALPKDPDKLFCATSTDRRRVLRKARECNAATQCSFNSTEVYAPVDFPMCDWTPLQYLWDKGAAAVMMMMVVALAVMRFVFVRVVVYGIQTSFRRTRCGCCDATPIKYRVNEKDPEFLEEWELSLSKTNLEQEAFESSDEEEVQVEEENDGLTREERIRKKYFKFDAIEAEPNPWTEGSTNEPQKVEQQDGEPKYE